MSPLLDAEIVRLMAQAMSYIRVTSTAELDTQTLATVRSLLEDVFAGEFSQHDWEHALGGLHALAFCDSELVGHGSVVARRLDLDGRPVEAGYVEGMAVAESHRRRGFGGAIMRALEDHIRSACELGALAATDSAAAFYAQRGWVRWTGPTEPDGEGAVHVLPVSVPVDPTATLAADWRSGDVW
jgi:aminoglycoside 2'-N-acetyltransferase I